MLRLCSMLLENIRFKENSNETLFYNVICDFTTCVGGGIYE